MDAVVSVAVRKLSDFLIQEVDFLTGVEEEVKWIRNELRYMQSFLRDAEEKQDGDERIHLWISDIRDIAFKTEDAIDTFYLELQGTGTSRYCFFISCKTDLYDIGKEIEALKKRVLDISRKREVYGISNFGSAREGTSGASSSILHELRITTSYADEEHVVGFEDDTDFLVAKLFLAEPRRSVVSILGMGGLGKTTLARKLYNKSSYRFDRHAWICVSQEWKTRDLLERIIKSFKSLTKDELEILEKMKDYDMERYLRELLEGHRYLMVIDDIWHEEAWESLRRALPDNHNGSRIIITTRIETVAELSDQRTYVHKLRFLRPDESWELFCKKAFPEESGARPQEMEKLGQEMVAKCDGLPLAIIVLGGLLSRKQYDEWQSVKERIWRELKNKSIHVSSLLELSYKDLPHELQLCFLYLALFPEDSEINAEKLIQLWVAEGFIPHEEPRLDLEELAEIYLKELNGRSLIQVVKWKCRTISTCRVHDLLRDLAVNKAKQLNFLHIYDGITNSAPSTEASSARRIVFHSKYERYMSLDHSQKQVRTLSFLNNQSLYDYNSFNYDDAIRLMKLICTRFKLLRVLELKGVAIANRKARLSLYEAIGKLIHLRYLGLEGIDIDELPKSIGNLQALQTLYVSPARRRISATVLPREICKLKQLRHLIGRFKISERRRYGRFGELTNLQSLKSLDMDGDKFALHTFVKLENLKILSVHSCSGSGSGYRFSVESLFNCRHLFELKIDGAIQNLPKGMHKCLPNLKFLYLRQSHLEEDPMPALEMLPNLLLLHFDFLYVKIMTCTATGFPQLEVFQIIEINDDSKFQVEEGAMPRLKVLWLADSKKCFFPERLRSLPQD